MSLSVTCECGRLFETLEANVGRRARCPGCGREFTVPKPALPPDLDFISWEAEPSPTSRKAIASLGIGALFFFTCLGGVPAILLGCRALADIQASNGRLKGRRMANAGIVLGVIGCLCTVVFLMPAYRSAREDARRAQCANKLKQIGLAMQNYHDANGTLPPAAITDKNGRPLLSWRVAILPYIEVSSLHSEFHLDEPWDSPHNLSLVERMPDFYACPSDRDRKPGMTGYEAAIGPAKAFTADFKPLTFSDFPDGLDNTILVGESRRCVPWTKPEDLPMDMSLPLAGLGSHHGYYNNGFNALFADGWVRFLKSSIHPRVLDALLTRNGKEVISSDSY